MKWRKSSEWTLESDRGNYVVTKFVISGEPKYQAIKLPGMSLLVSTDRMDCRSACEADYKGRTSA